MVLPSSGRNPGVPPRDPHAVDDLLDGHTSDIATNAADIATNAADIATLDGRVDDHDTDIAARLTQAEADLRYPEKAATEAHIASTANPHGTTAAQTGAVPTTRTVAGKALSSDITLVRGDVGLGNVDNTSDANKPVSTAQQTALNAKVNTATISASGKGYVNHGATASTARPTGYASVEWIGSVQPTNMANGDTWVVTP